MLIIFILFWIAVAALWAHHFFEGEILLADLWREWKLSRRSLVDWDNEWQSRSDRSQLIISLTTIPSRIDLIQETLKSLMDQSLPPGKIILNLPKYSHREACAYVIPDWLSNLASVEIRPCEDWGPATKLIPSLLQAPADQPILIVDDDRIYPRWMVARMQAAVIANPNRALTFAGWVVPEDLIDRATTVLSNIRMSPPAPVRAHRLRQPREVDVMQGVMGYAVRPRYFDLGSLTDFSTGPDALRYVDDVRTSALCQVQKWVIPAPSLSFLPKRHYRHFKRTALGALNRGSGRPEDRNNSIGVRYFKDQWLVGGPRSS